MLYFVDGNTLYRREMYKQVFRLSYSLLGEIVGEWLELVDLSRLDCACTPAKQRTHYMVALSTSSVNIRDPLKSECKANAKRFAKFLQWINHRHLRVCTLSFPMRVTEAIEHFPSHDEVMSRVLEMDFSACIDISDHVLNKLTNRSAVLTDIRVGSRTFRSFVTDAALADIANNCRRLAILNIENNHYITGKGVSVICESCISLRSVRLFNCSLVDDVALLSLALSSTRLQDLRISENLLMTPVGLSAVVSNCLDLETLHIIRCRTSLPALASGKRLESLYRFQYTGSTWCVVDPNIDNFLAHCPNLEYLALYGVHFTTETSLAPVNWSPQNLREVVLSTCNGLNCATLLSIAPLLSQVHSLTLHGEQINDAVVECVAQHCPELVKLDLAWCHRLTDAVLHALSAGCARLEKLVVKGCRLLTSSAVCVLIKQKVALQCVDLQYCSLVSGGLLSQMDEVSALHKIEIIV